MRASRNRLAGAVFVLALAVMGCGGPGSGGGPGASATGSRARVGAVLPMFSHPFFLAQKRGLEDKAKELGLEIDVRDGQDDDVKQIAQVETLINLGCKALILCPRDEDALVPAVEAANRAGVPVIALNRRINGGNVLSYVGADDAEGGMLQGEAVAEALGPKGGKIIYLEGTEGSSPQRKRSEGLTSVLKAHPEIVIADRRFAGFQEDRAKGIMTDLVRRFAPGEIRAVVAQSDEMALPAAEVIRTEGWKDVPVFGFDGSHTAFEAVKDGRLKATVLQDPYEQGVKAMETMAAHLKGHKPDSEVITPLRLITGANVDKFRPAY
ncbi:D-ribose-binding periplasmic protein precursor [Aquisphaera giovannonii]|uniref:D-ribose-binding periplasmic protein n=1 Tax=Aquisphaera giovannonii TaxID=406548 RepID=A0A5B9W9W9_9BACT|nr:sugar ABC transporter substrate-binding protein [Aquisphaera giovannonii]QEH37039.1 D-ribose-binding periplasmic protein precursor [Aquisphaera giovannonii]